MKQDSGNEAERMMTEAEFAEAMRDPEFFEQTMEQWRRILRGEFGEIPAEARAQIETAVRKADEQAAIALVTGKMHALLHLLERPAGSMLAEDRLAQCQALVEEITDALLDTPEPHRSEFMTDFVPLREALLALKIKE